MKFGIIGRSHGTCFVTNSTQVNEVLHLTDGRSLSFVQLESSFSNPNGHVNEKALNWICSAVQHATYNHIATRKVTSSISCAVSQSDRRESYRDEDSTVSSDDSGNSEDQMISKSCDLLELYCGNGNHTVAIAGGAYLIISYCVISYYFISYHIISYHIISYHTISYHITYDIISYHIISYLIR